MLSGPHHFVCCSKRRSNSRVAQELRDSPGSALAAEQGQQPCRTRVAGPRNSSRAAAARPSSDQVDAEVADKRAMDDPGLQRGAGSGSGSDAFIGPALSHSGDIAPSEDIETACRASLESA